MMTGHSLSCGASGLHGVHNCQEVCECLLAFGGILIAFPDGVGRAVERLVDGVPVSRSARLYAGFRLVPFGLKVLDARLSSGEVALVDERCDVGGDATEGR